MSDLINRQDAIDILSLGEEILNRVLDDMDVVGTDREKYSWGLGLIESNIKDIEDLPSADASLMQDRCKIDASSDLISRRALRDAMYHEAFETDTEMQRWDSGCWIRYRLFEKTIINLPSAERTGEWEVYAIGAYTCSCCNFYSRSKSNYCPNCGARMKGEKE